MPDFGKLLGKAKDIVRGSGDKIAAGVDKATDVVDKKTGGKYHDKLEKVDAAAEKLNKSGQATTAPDTSEAPAGSGAPEPSPAPDAATTETSTTAEPPVSGMSTPEPS